MAGGELARLKKEIEIIERKAREFGLDFFPMRFEICPADIIYTFGAYGMPVRFSHWSFGKAFYNMKMQYDLNLSRIYELVINSNPCYAFLLEGNSLIQQKLVIAHVYGHSDFFKNNSRFSRTSRDMIETMSINSNKIKEYGFRYGQEKVENLLDAVLAIQEHIDPHYYIKGINSQEKKNKITTPYDDLWELDNVRKEEKEQEKPSNTKKIPPQPEKDMLKFIMEHAPKLEDWERDVIGIVRQEMFYFWPQIETKIMNEGWAVYWHLKIMRELPLNEDEAIEFAKMHAGIILPSKFSLNPYFVGFKIYEDLAKKEGEEKIFEVRKLENDISFIRNYLTEDLIEELDLYLYEKQGQNWVVTEKKPEKIRQNIVSRLANFNFPYIVVEDGDYNQNGELYLKHCYEDRELDIKYLEKTLPYVYKLWGKKVHLETVLDDKKVLFSYNGNTCSRSLI